MAAAHPLKTVFALALLARLTNIVLLKGNDSFFAEPDSHLYWTLGAGLAKTEVTVILEELLDRYPRLRLTEGQELAFHPNISFRGPQELWLEHD